MVWKKHHVRNNMYVKTCIKKFNLSGLWGTSVKIIVTKKGLKIEKCQKQLLNYNKVRAYTVRIFSDSGIIGSVIIIWLKNYVLLFYFCCIILFLHKYFIFLRKKIIIKIHSQWGMGYKSESGIYNLLNTISCFKKCNN